MKKELTLTDILIDQAKKEEKYFKHYLKYARKIKKTAEELLGEVKVFVFGSILSKDEVPIDIDILIVSTKLRSATKRSEIRGKILEKTCLSSPFEIHLTTPREYKEWYSHFIKEKVEI